MNLSNYFKRLRRWFLKGKWLFFFIATLLLPLVFIQFEINETGIIVYGLLLQLVGTLVLIISLKERSVLFGKSPFFKSLFNYLKEFPLKAKTTTLSVSGSIHEHSSASADLHATILPKENFNDVIRYIQDEINFVNSRIEKEKAALNDKINSLSRKLENLRDSSQKTVKELETKVSDGGAVIKSYTVTSNPGGFTGTGSASPITVTGLTNGTAYTFIVTATNAIGTSVASSASNSVTPTTVPGAPTIGTATAGNAQASVIFTAPVSNGGSVITSYTVTSSPGNITGTGSASPITVTGLTNGTAYTFTVTATNAIGNSAASSASNSVTPSVPAPITDNDGNVYNTVAIGTQVWMAENLKTTKYNDGTAIPNITVAATWAAATTGAYSDYGNTPANSTTYGRLYNWFVVDNNAATKEASNGGKNVCPTSWHVPTDAEWTTLTTFLGSESVAGGKLKETGTTHWITPNTGATNETGFTVLPGGYRNDDGTCNDVGYDGNWWSSTEYYTPYAWARNMYNSTTSVSRKYLNERYGFSVRCVRD